MQRTVDGSDGHPGEFCYLGDPHFPALGFLSLPLSSALHALSAPPSTQETTTPVLHFANVAGF